MISICRSIGLTAGIPAIVMCFVSPLAFSNAGSGEVIHSAGSTGHSAGTWLMAANSAETDTSKSEATDKRKDHKQKIKEEKLEEQKKKKEYQAQRKEEERKKKEDKKKSANARKQPAAQGQPVAKPAVTTPAAPATTPAKAAAPAAAAPAAAAATPAPAQPTLVVKTYPMSNVGPTYAYLNGHVSCPGKKGRAWFEWGDSQAFGQGTGVHGFTGEASMGDYAYGLAAGKQYYYRAVADCGGNFVHGETRSFKK
jgi:hypothetical protein